MTCLARYGGLILLLRRGSGADMAGSWSGISGVIEGDEDPLFRARTEMSEEAGISEAVLAGRADVIQIGSGGRMWHVHPFLFDVESKKVTLNWENDSYEWVDPGNLSRYGTVPGLDRVFASLL